MKTQITILNRCFVLCFIALAVLVTKPARAQSMGDFKNTTPEQRAQMQTSMMKSKLQLDTQQVTKAQAINLNYANKMQTIIKSDDGRMSKFKQVVKLQEAKDKELKLVFTPAQFKQYQDFEKEMKNRLMQKAQANQ